MKQEVNNYFTKEKERVTLNAHWSLPLVCVDASRFSQCCVTIVTQQVLQQIALTLQAYNGPAAKIKTVCCLRCVRSDCSTLDKGFLAD